MFETLGNVSDFFGSAYAREEKDRIVIGGFDSENLLADVQTIWGNKKLQKNVFDVIRPYRLVFHQFFAPDVLYLFEEIREYKKRKSNGYRLRQVINDLKTQTWLRSMDAQHGNVLDFSQLKLLRHSLFEHQIKTLEEYNVKVPRMCLKGFLLGTPPGCLTGDSLICFNRGKKGFTLPLKKAYEHFNGLCSNYRSWDKKIPTYVRSFTGETIQLHLIKDIVYSGIRDVYRVTLASGHSTKCTADHEIKTMTGYTEAKDIVGKPVMIDSKYSIPSGKKPSKPRDRDFTVSKYHPYGRRQFSMKFGFTYRISLHRAVYESHYLNSMTLVDFREALKDPERVKTMKFLDPQTHTVHHKNHDHDDNTPENLEAMTHEYHKKYHAKADEAYKNFNQGVPVYSRAVSFEYVGQEPTYDIICEDPHRNFVANNMVVHNSGKTIMSIGLSACLHADVTFFIVPKATVSTVWFDGIRDEFGDRVKIWRSTDEWSSADDIPFDCQYYIFHFEALPLAHYLAKRLKYRKPFIAIDESQGFNEIKTVRTQRLVDLTRIMKCQHTVWASGTPIKAIGTEAIPLLQCIDPFFTPEVEQKFKGIFTASAKNANDILRNRLDLISHKIPESSYMKIPPPIETILKIKIPNGERFTVENIQKAMKQYMIDRYEFYKKDMKRFLAIYEEGIVAYSKTIKTPQQKKELEQYRDYVKIIISGFDPIQHGEIAKFCKEFEGKKIAPVLPPAKRKPFKDATSVVKYCKLKVLGESLGLLAKKRAECAAELAVHGNLPQIVLAADKKTIVFSSFIDALEVAKNIFIKHGLKEVHVYGDTTKDVTNIVNQFKKDPNANPILATLQSLSASQTLIVANTMIFLNAPFRDYIYDQAFHRMFRIGQDVQTHLFILSLDTGQKLNISTRSEEILKWSREMVGQIVGTKVSDKDAEGIVKRLGLNPPSTFETAIAMFRNLFE